MQAESKPDDLLVNHQHDHRERGKHNDDGAGRNDHDYDAERVLQDEPPGVHIQRSVLQRVDLLYGQYRHGQPLLL
jgi:hypothetical protein